MTEKRHFEVERLDEKTGIVSRRVIEWPSPDFDEIVGELFDDESSVTGRFVSNDIPLGERAHGKVFKLRTSSSRSNELTVNYEIKDGVARFENFKEVLSDGFVIGVRHSEEGDLLKVNLGKAEFAPTDVKEVSRIRWVLRAIYNFNSELLEEAADSDDDEEDTTNSEQQTETSESETKTAESESNQDHQW